jgi:hypothetical protein
VVDLGEINISPDQLEIIYKEGLENYKEAVISYDSAASEAIKSLGYFNTFGIEKYLKNAVEMATRILQFTSEGPLFYTGFEAFGYKITSMAMYLKDIDKIEGLGNYPELERFFRVIIEKGLKYDDLKEFDKFILESYEHAKKEYDAAMRYKTEWLRKFDSLTEEELAKQLKEAGFTEEEIEDFLDSLPKDENNNGRYITAGSLAIISIIISIGLRSSTAASVAGDAYFFGTDTPLWLANTPLANAIQAMAESAGASGASIIGGALAGVIIGTVVALSDGEITLQEWLEQAGAASIGGIVGGIMMAGGAFPLLAVAASVATTYVASKFFESFFEMPGGIPRDFENWSDEEKWKYIEGTTGIDHEKLKVLRQAKESGNFTDEELASMGRCVTDEDYVMDPNCEDPCAIAFYIYMTYGDGVTGTDPTIMDNILQSEALRYVNGFDYDEIIKYLEMFEEVCG